MTTLLILLSPIYFVLGAQIPYIMPEYPSLRCNFSYELGNPISLHLLTSKKWYLLQKTYTGDEIMLCWRNTSFASFRIYQKYDKEKFEVELHVDTCAGRTLGGGQANLDVLNEDNGDFIFQRSK
jgi:hypothetical protein